MEDVARQIERLAAAGDKLAAIKVLRQATGMGLAQAKEAVEALMEGKPLPPFGGGGVTGGSGAGASTKGSSESLPADVRAAAESGDRIQAIRLLREHSGLGLKEAKEQLDRLLPPPAGKGGCLPVFLLGLSLAGAGWLCH